MRELTKFKMVTVGQRKLSLSDTITVDKASNALKKATLQLKSNAPVFVGLSLVLLARLHAMNLDERAR